MRSFYDILTVKVNKIQIQKQIQKQIHKLLIGASPAYRLNMTKTTKNEHLDKACKLVCDSGMNIYSLMGHYRKRSKYTGIIPDDVIINVCNQYLKPHKPILNQWAWFVAALHRATQDHFHAQNKKEVSMPSNVKNIFKMMSK